MLLIVSVLSVGEDYGLESGSDSNGGGLYAELGYLYLNISLPILAPM